SPGSRDSSRARRSSLAPSSPYVHVRLPDQDCARILQPADDLSVLAWDTVREPLEPCRRLDPGRVIEILYRSRKRQLIKLFSARPSGALSASHTSGTFLPRVPRLSLALSK